MLYDLARPFADKYVIANLLRYQRAYQAAGKAMQIANTLFDTLLQLGR